MAVTFSTINSPHSWDVQPFESLDAQGAARMLNRLQSMNEHMQRDIDKLRAERDALRDLLEEWLDGDYDGTDYQNRVCSALNGHPARP